MLVVIQALTVDRSLHRLREDCYVRIMEPYSLHTGLIGVATKDKAQEVNL